jgi:hypothetical protein
MKAFVNFRRGDSPSITARIHECLKSLGWNVFVDVDSLALGADFRNFDYFSRSGDDDLDRSLIIELKRIVKILEINPGFKHINQMNAFAEPQIIVEGTQGTVF